MAQALLWVKCRHSRRKNHVRFTPESGHLRRENQCLLIGLELLLFDTMANACQF
jgi:hypothetical protein